MSRKYAIISIAIFRDDLDLICAICIVRYKVNQQNAGRRMKR